jgi:selenocysteine-specific elongation factor
MARVIVGTAGHIDHGKSTLVRALTGTDPDRLPEEKRRGITVDLGYAFLGDTAAIIDVPGHERLIRNMVAGAATIDFALLVVAADDGIMPQTTEHLQILRLLGVRHGAVVITKCDAVETDWLDLVEDQIRSAVAGTFLQSAPVFRVDSLSARGIPELAHALTVLFAALPPREDRGVFRLPIDRVFTVKGHGTVITGTVLAGSLRRDAKLVVLPGGYEVRVKRIESHGHEAEQVAAGQRAALNLMGATERLERGHTLTLPGKLRATSRLKIALELLRSAAALKDRQRVRFLIGTQEVIGRLRLLQKSDENRRCYAHVLLENEVTAVWGDHFILRRYSPLETLGGGRVLDAGAPRLRAPDVPQEIELAKALDTLHLREAVLAYVRLAARPGASVEVAAALFGVLPSTFLDHCRSAAPPDAIVEIGGYVISRANLDQRCETVRLALANLYARSPESAGFGRAELRLNEAPTLPDAVFDRVLQELVARGQLVQDGGLFREPERRLIVSPAQAELMERVASLLAGGGFTPPSAAGLSETLSRALPEIEKTLVLLERAGRARRLGADLFFDAQQFERAMDAVQRSFDSAPELAVADAARLLSSSRKYVVPFLEYLDGKGITLRSGNVRVRGRKSKSPTPEVGDGPTP